MTNDQLRQLISILTESDRQRIQDIIDNRLKQAVARQKPAIAPVECFDLSYETAKAMRVKSFFLGDQVPPKN